jgi:hypothetical protein
MDLTVAIFAAFGVAKAPSFGQRLLAGRNASDSGLLQGHGTNHDCIVSLARLDEHVWLACMASPSQ